MNSAQTLSPETFLSIADHTLLAPEATTADLQAFVEQAVRLGVARVCVSPTLIPKEKHGLEVVTVIGFPTGVHAAHAKAVEAADAIAAGADEVDMVVNPGLIEEGDWAGVESEIRAVRDASLGRVLKVTFETAKLEDDEIVAACRAAEAAGADFVRTSMGVNKADGATVHAVRLMAATVGDRLGVKASGGINTAESVREMWQAGATRFGVSAAEAIVKHWERSETTGDGSN